ncbi:DUF72 domain-containing protein [Dactylosporangium roseum]|uniref:DUF72 domain-containing protein n=1 Tax=Dactylosporangium roseum TaxID=47989 RepID=A0ABY5YW74_9ACTN|nr:DUF72 domain-containing protein [Dactylosporangium roseum]UWZ33649.1 DUF72 domain-containing protein [Dactylosporangium roseum]
MAIHVGTASWTDPTLLESGWYPADAGTAEQRLAYYASQFGLVEVDATYYHPPNEQTARLCGAVRCPVAVELRHKSWFEGDNAAETLDFLRAHELPFVGVDMPQGHKSSVPPVLEATADLAMMRFHGRSDRWTSKDIHEKFGYEYSVNELREWVPKLREVAATASNTHVLMNNCYSDYAQRNAAELIELLDGD